MLVGRALAQTPAIPCCSLSFDLHARLPSDARLPLGAAFRSYLSYFMNLIIAEKNRARSTNQRHKCKRQCLLDDIC